MQATELIEKLERVACGVSTRQPIPSLRCVFFDSGLARTFNDIVAAECECEVPIEGGIDHELLLKWLKASGTGDVKIKQLKGRASFTLGKAKLELELQPLSAYAYSPIDGDDKVIIDTDKVGAAFRAASVVVGDDASAPQFVGYTVHAKGKVLTIYTTDGITGTRATAPCKLAKGCKSWQGIIPAEFVQSVIRAKDSTLTLGEGWAELADEDVIVTTRLLDGCDPSQYAQLFDQATKDDQDTLPEGFLQLIERSAVVCTNGENIMLQASDGVLECTAETPLGKTHNKVKTEHEDFSHHYQPARLVTAAEGCESFSIIDIGIALSGPCFVRVLGRVVT